MPHDNRITENSTIYQYLFKLNFMICYTFQKDVFDFLGLRVRRNMVGYIQLVLAIGFNRILYYLERELLSNTTLLAVSLRKGKVF
ncbi:hypothetical protein SAMN02746089_01151 [Caldanaerobius fijiensis DSM 17918]|uniref:Uncharacterized protein n=1 Tax=Caldanaerobius fijiensis DSM 17918 TaxID=1121256 RepID=A0A1M4Y418_9THEO|nr:hypothetical protein SAMN02746089_01151 [Caldanaerobius fijiensis DSM 17918]